MQKQKAVLIAGIIVSIVLLGIAIFIFTNTQRMQNKVLTVPKPGDAVTISDLKSFLCKDTSTEILNRLYYILPLIGIIVVLGGSIMYYLTTEKAIKQDQSLKKNTHVILNFLSPDEKAVIQLLLQKNGKSPQYELMQLPDTNKVKAHRLVTKLEEKGIITRQKEGKANIVELDKELYDVLKD